MLKATRPSPRPSLTTEQLGRLTADEFVRLKLTDEEKSRLQEINDLRKQERAKRAARLRDEQKPILAELQNKGWNVNSVWDFVNTSDRYESAVPILLKHLRLPYSDRTREGIARALAVPDAQYAWATLVDEYRKAPTGKGIVAPGDTQELPLGAKNGLAVAVAAAATEAAMEELIILAKDASLGESRLLLLGRIKRSKSSVAKKAIEETGVRPSSGEGDRFVEQRAQGKMKELLLKGAWTFVRQPFLGPESCRHYYPCFPLEIGGVESEPAR